MTSVDADLKSGRRLETARRSESIIYMCVCYRSSNNTTSTLLEYKVFLNLEIGAYAFSVSTIVRNGVNQTLLIKDQTMQMS